MTWKLQTINGEFTGTEITIERDMLVGRHQEADIVLAAAEISRRHAALFIKETLLYVQDLKSSNGTYVNDLRIENETLLKDGDIVQFSSLKFSVLAPVVAQQLLQQPELQVAALEIEPAAPAVVVAEPVVITQPAEAVATAEVKTLEINEPVVVANAPSAEEIVATVPVVEKTVAEKMNDQGMPDLKERDSTVQLSVEGMPKNVGVPKPAPIPEGVDLNAAPVRHEACEVDIPPTCIEQEKETQKNASIGMMALLAIFFVAIVAWFIFN